MPFSLLILCHPLLLLPSIPPSIRVFSNESTLHMRWPKYWSFSFSIIPSKEILGLISFRMDSLDFLAVQGTLFTWLLFWRIDFVLVCSQDPSCTHLTFIFSPSYSDLKSRIESYNVFWDFYTIMTYGFMMKVKEESEKVGLKLNIRKTKIMASGPITSWQIYEEAMETVRYFRFGGLQNHCRWWLQTWN